MAIDSVRKPFLLRLTACERQLLLSSATVRRHDHDSIILDQFDPGIDMFLVLEGRVTARSFSVDGKEVSYAEIEQDDCFGEFAALDGGPRSTAIVAAGPVITARVSAARLEAAMLAEPGIALAMARHLTAKLRQLTERVSHFSTLSVSRRVQRELYRMARSASAQGATATVNPAPTHHELATRLSTHREAISREISALESRNILRSGRRSITFLDIAALGALVDDGH